MLSFNVDAVRCNITSLPQFSWLLMRYPVPKPLRAKLVRLYYELCLLPGIEPRITRSWMDMTTKLLAHKVDGRRKLEASDLKLPWKPLWRVLQKDLWGRGHLSASR
jgi:proteasome activator subunit 4